MWKMKFSIIVVISAVVVSVYTIKEKGYRFCRTSEWFNSTASHCYEQVSGTEYNEEDEIKHAKAEKQLFDKCMEKKLEIPYTETVTKDHIKNILKLLQVDKEEVWGNLTQIIAECIEKENGVGKEVSTCVVKTAKEVCN